MENPAALAHAGSGNDHERTAQIDQRLGLVYIPYVRETLKAKRIFVVDEKLRRVLIEQLRMLAKDVGHIYSERAVDEDRERWNGIGINQLVQQEDQLLRASYRESRHDHLSTALIGTIDDRGQLRRYRLNGLMDAIAIGALHDDVIRGRELFGIANDRKSDSAQVAGEAQADFSSVGLEIQKHASGTQDVAGLEGLIAKARPDLGRRMHRRGTEKGKGGFGIFHCVERLHHLIVVAEVHIERLAAQRSLVEKRGVFFLKRGRVHEHGAAEVGCARTGVDGPMKSVFHQQRKIATVIDVSVGEHDCRDVLA